MQSDDTLGKQVYAAYEGAGKEAGLLPIVENLRVLEVGFGTGKLLEALHQRGNDVYGVDAGRAIVDHAKAAGFEHTFLVDVSEEALPFEDDFFEAVYCYEVFEHLTNPHRLVSEIRRVLVRGGLLFFSVPAQENDMGYGVNRHTFVYPGLLERANLERFFMQMYFRVDASLHADPTDWLVGHNYVFSNVKPSDRKDVVEVIVGDYGVGELYHDVATPETLRREIERELKAYDEMLTHCAVHDLRPAAEELLSFTLAHYPAEYDFHLRVAAQFIRNGRPQWTKWMVKQMLDRGQLPDSVMLELRELLRGAV